MGATCPFEFIANEVTRFDLTLIVYLLLCRLVVIVLLHSNGLQSGSDDVISVMHQLLNYFLWMSALLTALSFALKNAVKNSNLGKTLRIIIILTISQYIFVCTVTTMELN